MADSELEWDAIKAPRPSFTERLAGKHFRQKTERFINDSIKEYAITADGHVDDDLADYIRRQLTQRCEVSMQRDVVEPAGWALLGGMAAGGAAVSISKHIEGRAITKGSLMAAVTSTSIGAALDLYRINRRFDCALKGALAGALKAKKEERSPLAEARRDEHRQKLRESRESERDEGYSR